MASLTVFIVMGRSFLQTALPTTLSTSDGHCLLHCLPMRGMSCLQNEYPHKWPSLWTDLLGMLPEGPGVVDMFCRILIAIDDDVISLDIAR